MHTAMISGPHPDGKYLMTASRSASGEVRHTALALSGLEEVERALEHVFGEDDHEVVGGYRPLCPICKDDAKGETQ